MSVKYYLRLEVLEMDEWNNLDYCKACNLFAYNDAEKKHPKAEIIEDAEYLNEFAVDDGYKCSRCEKTFTDFA